MSNRGMPSRRITASEPRGKNLTLTLDCGHTKLVDGKLSRERWAFCAQCPGK